MMEISFQDAFQKCATFIDVRSPVEFKEDHIPGSINVPLFTDLERHDIGIMYHKEGKDKAIKEGYGLVLNKINSMVSQIKNAATTSSLLVIYCFRGGMRSQSVVNLLNSMGIKCQKMTGGYKKYREDVVSFFKSYKNNQKIYSITGFTGSGKTNLIRIMDNSIDLEGLAEHRSSVFGAVGLNPRSQKLFESLLMSELIKKKDLPYLIYEYESKKIGNVQIPDSVFSLIRKSEVIKIQAPMIFRIKTIYDDYIRTNMPSLDEVSKIVYSIKDKLSTKVADELIELYKNKNYDEFIKILLEKYYDPLYLYSIEGSNYSKTIDYQTLQECKEKLQKLIDSSINL